jgi:uncharacterized protein YndB with AHSA1/START domain
MVNIQHNFSINASAHKVYDAITTIEGLRKWWTTDRKGDPKPEGELKFGFGTEHFNIMKVGNCQNGKSVSWECIDSDSSEWIGTHIFFTLREDENHKTHVKFEHNDWRQPTDFYGSCNYHWGQFMVSLKMLCETGKGLPYEVK